MFLNKKPSGKSVRVSEALVFHENKNSLNPGRFKKLCKESFMYLWQYNFLGLKVNFLLLVDVENLFNNLVPHLLLPLKRG